MENKLEKKEMVRICEEEFGVYSIQQIGRNNFRIMKGEKNVSNGFAGKLHECVNEIAQRLIEDQTNGQTMTVQELVNIERGVHESIKSVYGEIPVSNNPAGLKTSPVETQLQEVH